MVCSPCETFLEYETLDRVLDVNMLCVVFVMPNLFVLSTKLSLRKKGTIHRVTIMLTTSKNVLSPGHNHLLTTGTDDPLL